jgi:hypothetical protein
MKTRLKLMERIMLPGILPEKASFEMGIVCQDIRKKIGITQDEVKRTGLKSLPGGGMQWDAAKDRAVEIEFTEMECELIKGSLEKASKANELPTDPAILELYRTFVVEPKVQPIKKTKKQ